MSVWGSLRSTLSLPSREQSCLQSGLQGGPSCPLGPSRPLTASSARFVPSPTLLLLRPGSGTLEYYWRLSQVWQSRGSGSDSSCWMMKLVENSVSLQLAASQCWAPLPMARPSWLLGLPYLTGPLCPVAHGGWLGVLVAWQ